MKSKTRKIMVLSIIGVLVLWLVSFIFRNAILLSGMTLRLEWAARFAPNVEHVETGSVYGKLNGNGNGINYFGAVLVTADSEEAVKALVASLQNDFEVVSYNRQYGSKITDNDNLQHRSIVFDTPVPNDQSSPYYTVWFYNSRHKASNLLDLAGH